MKIKGIARETLNFVLSVSRASHPKEFAGMLYADHDVITHVDVPLTQSSRVNAVMDLFTLPVSTHLVGSVHSHPSGDLYPSDADIRMFMQNGDYHIIVAYPYQGNNWICYDRAGVQRHLKVLDIEIDQTDKVLDDIVNTFGEESD